MPAFNPLGPDQPQNLSPQQGGVGGLIGNGLAPARRNTIGPFGSTALGPAAPRNLETQQLPTSTGNQPFATINDDQGEQAILNRLLNDVALIAAGGAGGVRVINANGLNDSQVEAALADALGNLGVWAVILFDSANPSRTVTVEDTLTVAGKKALAVKDGVTMTLTADTGFRVTSTFGVELNQGAFVIFAPSGDELEGSFIELAGPDEDTSVIWRSVGEFKVVTEKNVNMFNYTDRVASGPLPVTWEGPIELAPTAAPVNINFGAVDGAASVLEQIIARVNLGAPGGSVNQWAVRGDWKWIGNGGVWTIDARLNEGQSIQARNTTLTGSVAVTVSQAIPVADAATVVAGDVIAQGTGASINFTGAPANIGGSLVARDAASATTSAGSLVGGYITAVSGGTAGGAPGATARAAGTNTQGGGTVPNTTIQSGAATLPTAAWAPVVQLN